MVSKYSVLVSVYRGHLHGNRPFDGALVDLASSLDVDHVEVVAFRVGHPLAKRVHASTEDCNVTIFDRSAAVHCDENPPHDWRAPGVAKVGNAIGVVITLTIQ